MAVTDNCQVNVTMQHDSVFDTTTFVNVSLALPDGMPTKWFKPQDVIDKLSSMVIRRDRVPVLDEVSDGSVPFLNVPGTTPGNPPNTRGGPPVVRGARRSEPAGRNLETERRRTPSVRWNRGAAIQQCLGSTSSTSSRAPTRRKRTSHSTAPSTCSTINTFGARRSRTRSTRLRVSSGSPVRRQPTRGFRSFLMQRSPPMGLFFRWRVSTRFRVCTSAAPMRAERSSATASAIWAGRFVDFNINQNVFSNYRTPSSCKTPLVTAVRCT